MTDENIDDDDLDASLQWVIIRGGGGATHERYVRSAVRLHYPAILDVGVLGFRVVRTNPAGPGDPEEDQGGAA